MNFMNTPRPNIVLFVAEDLDYEGVNCYDASQTSFTGVIKAGNQNLPEEYVAENVLTPTMDALAASGFCSTNYYCVSAICTPSRYSILTGRYPERNPHFCEMYPPREQANIFFNIGMTRDESNLAKALQQHGYTTGITGKWHNFPQEVKIRLKDMNTAIPDDADASDPQIREAISAWYQFAVNYLKDGFGWDVVDRVYYDNPEPFHPQSLHFHNLEWIIEGALNFLDERQDSDNPFFLYVPVTTPHSRYKNKKIFDEFNPLVTPSGLLDKAPAVMMSREEIARTVKEAGLPDYAVEGLWLDEGLKAVLHKLEAIGKTDETCFIFTTDHPTAGKETCHLGRIPFMMRWPGKITAGSAGDALLSQTDLAATILDIAGCPIPADMQMDGASFKSFVTGEQTESPREQALLEVTNSRAVVAGDWKYIANRLPRSLHATADVHKTGWLGSNFYDNEWFSDSVRHEADRLFPHYFDEDHLYNLKDDPCEQRNLAGDPDYADILQEMKERLRLELSKLPHPFGECSQGAAD